jgi:N-acetylated-alpha-linked acidic dipeptidase
MRLADATILPINFNSFYKTVADYETEVKTLTDNLRTETEAENKMIQSGLYNLAKDPTKTYGPPKAKEPVPYLDFSPVDNALASLKSAAQAFDTVYKKAPQLPLSKQKQLNEILYKAERSLTQENGLPRRSWYKHLIYAPGYYTGYGVKTLPGIREAIEQRNWKEAQENIEILAKTLQSYTEQVNEAITLLK